ncbi:type II toxin-antitoxin system HicA family toxin [Dyadobacter beijingensis]
MKSSEFVRLLKSDGWFIVRQEGSHVTMRHPVKKGQLGSPITDRKR